ncbi:MAG: Na+/H+ antiporter subunit D, partial [Ilumatobacteraceae bacterium]
MNALVPLPVVIPLAAAAACVLLGRFRTLQRLVATAAMTAVLGVSIALLVGAEDRGILVHRSGGWPAPLGITLVVDRLSALMLVVSALVLLVVAVFAIGESAAERREPSFHPLYLVLAAGVAASFVTADLFNLFVAFEMMLSASYVLITLGGRPDQVRSGMSYVVISLVASTLFITLLALLYASTGTINMADLAVRLDDVDPELRAAFSIGLLIVFGIKAGLFPLFFWLPDSYPTAPGPVTAIFAGLLTKVGVYAIIRSQTLLFGLTEWMGTVLVVVAVLTMVVGVLGAIAQDDMKRILAFHIISQIGYMIFGLGLATVAGLAGAVFYIVHHIIVKTALFLVAGLVSRRAGSSRLSEVGGLVRDAPVIAILFAVPALSLAGLPPFSGFLAKFALVDAGLAASAWIPVAASLAVGLFTLFSMTKIWAGVFWGVAEERPVDAPVTDR